MTHSEGRDDFCDIRLTLNVQSRALAADLPVSVSDKSEGCMDYLPDRGHIQVGWGHPTLSEDDAK